MAAELLADDPAHGGELAWARRRFPAAGAPWLDLSTGINPHAYPFSAPGGTVWTRLPESVDIAALSEVAAVCYGAAGVENVAAVPGVQALIQLLPRLCDPGRVAVVGPTYAEHARAWAAAGHAVEIVSGVSNLVNRFDTIVLTNPNNPDGTRHAPDVLAELGGRVVIDESYADVASEFSLAGRVSGQTLVMRSFGKFYGLPGLRLGFAVAAPEVTARVRDAFGPWPVSGPAVAVGREALADAAWADAMRGQLTGEVSALDAVLAKAGLSVVGGTDLFRLVESHQADAVFERLGDHGILVRRFAEQPGWLRFGLPGCRTSLARLAKALA
ncbi:MAG: threonine-phosphate decarboxylase CobD [Alphaproteobacteria bacterium]|nr:threonine-phosphate decarboxylase CobD [Alphaproteobacteria bacterium]